MRTVVIGGSPHKNGNSAAMAELFCRTLGGEVCCFAAYDGDVLPCTDCGRCAEKTGCSLSDRGAELLRKIGEADVIVLAAPVYFSDLPGPLIGMASRLQYLWMRRRAGERVLPQKKRYGVILLSGGGSGKPDRAIQNARCYLHMLETEAVAEILTLHTDQIPFERDTHAREQILAAAERIRTEITRKNNKTTEN